VRGHQILIVIEGEREEVKRRGARRIGLIGGEEVEARSVVQKIQDRVDGRGSVKEIGTKGRRKKERFFELRFCTWDEWTEQIGRLLLVKKD